MTEYSAPCPDRDFDEADQLLRRFPPAFYDPETRELDPGVFKNYPFPELKRCSVNWSECSTIDEALGPQPRYGIASIPAGFCMAEDQEIERAPEDDNDSHCNLIGEKPMSRRRRFAKAADVVRVPQS